MDARPNQPKPLSGTVPAIASKSMAHRIIIAAALANGVTRVACDTTCADIDATIRCLTALGARITLIEGGYEIHPMPKSLEHGLLRALAGGTLDCGESGSTLRFMLPVACALGADATFVGAGRWDSARWLRSPTSSWRQAAPLKAWGASPYARRVACARVASSYPAT